MSHLLQNRNGIWRVRIRVPVECYPSLKRIELVQSLKTGSKTEARRLAPAVVAKFLAMIEAARPRWKLIGYDPAFHEPHWVMGDRFHVGDVPPGAETPPVPSQEALPADKPTFTTILDTWALEHGNAGTLRKYTRMMSELAKFVGTDDGNKITAPPGPNSSVKKRRQMMFASNHCRGGICVSSSRPASQIRG